MRLRYTEKARLDLELAFSWYEQQQAGLGKAFLDCVEEVISAMREMPRLYPAHHQTFRRALTRRFPFSLFYTIEQDEIILHAIFDNRQDPSRLP